MCMLESRIFDAKACKNSQLESSRPIDASPVEDVEGEEEDGEDDEEGEVGHGVVVLLPLGPIQLAQLHLEQDRSIPGQRGLVVQTGRIRVQVKYFIYRINIFLSPNLI